MKLRLHDHKVPRSFVALEVTTPERIVNKGSVADIYDDADYGRGSYCSPAPTCFSPLPHACRICTIQPLHACSSR
jgi:hypothetical protein